MAPIFTTKPPVTSGISSMEIARIVKFMSEHFQVEQPKIKISNTRRGKYSVLHKTIIMGTKSWRGVHTVVHEFAHHLDMLRRGHAGTFMAQPRVRRMVVGSWGRMEMTRIGRREFHGESFTLALEDCVMAVFGNQNLYAWESEYKSVKSNHAKRFTHRVDGVPTQPKPVGSTWLIFRPTITQRSLPMAAESQPQPQPVATVKPEIKPETRAKLKAVGNAAWAAPSADNGWQGGCLWVRREADRKAKAQARVRGW